MVFKKPYKFGTNTDYIRLKGIYDLFKNNQKTPENTTKVVRKVVKDFLSSVLIAPVLPTNQNRHKGYV